jgi:hypothetical protein
MQSFTALDLSAGKQLFESNCINCHVGGATLPNPRVSLSLADLRGASPPRDNIRALVQFTPPTQKLRWDGGQLHLSGIVPQTATDEGISTISRLYFASGTGGSRLG